MMRTSLTVMRVCSLDWRTQGVTAMKMIKMMERFQMKTVLSKMESLKAAVVQRHQKRKMLWKVILY